MEVKKLKVTTRDQFTTLGEFMEKNPAVARGVKFCELQKMTRDKYNEMWKQLTVTLNSLGPPQRTTAEWQKVWNDIKRKAKEKLAYNKKEVHATGGGPNTQKVLSPIEELAASVLSLDHAVDPPGPTYGLGAPGPSGTSQSRLEISDVDMYSSNSESEEEDLVTDRFPSASPVTPSRISRDIRSRNNETALRMEQISAQTEILKEIKQNTEEIACYTRKRFELEKEKFVHNKNKDELELKRKAEELKYKLALLECKKRKLDLMSGVATEPRE